jgi:hypothetical protein
MLVVLSPAMAAAANKMENSDQAEVKSEASPTV